MREIKFRAWDKENFRMIYQDSSSDKFIWQLGTDGIELIETDGIHTSKINADFMQYTGLKDKNGKEIYEGDIIKADKNYPACAVKFGFHNNDCNNGWYAETKDGALCELNDSWNMTPTEVIGSIYENPELLRG